MHARRDAPGFTLIEVTIAMIMVMVGVLAIAGAIALGAREVTGSQDQLLASERAAEAAESVFKQMVRCNRHFPARLQAGAVSRLTVVAR